MDLCSMPVEVTLEIFKNCSNIDDALHLGRTCGHLNSVLEGSWMTIFKAIITNSQTYRYDLDLCYLNDAFEDFASRHLSENRNNDIEPEAFPHDSLFYGCFDNAEANQVSEKHVADILARWQGLRFFFDLYRNPVVREEFKKFPLVIDDNPRSVTTINKATILREITRTEQKLTSVPQLEDVERFYVALTGCWWGMRARNYAQICRSDKQSDQNKLWECLQMFWLEEGERTLQDNIERMEVFDFVYSFLIHNTKLAAPERFPLWAEGEEQYSEEDQAFDSMAYVRTLPVFLSPGDVAELLLKTCNAPQREERNESHEDEIRWYLKQRGWLDNCCGPVTVPDEEETLSPLLDLAHEVELLRNVMIPMETAFCAKWLEYRTEIWQKEARGRFEELKQIVVEPFEREFKPMSWICDDCAAEELDSVNDNDGKSGYMGAQNY